MDPGRLAETLQCVGVMAMRKTSDRHPGPLPEIHSKGGNLIFHLVIAGVPARLVIRCDDEGSVWASIDTDR